MVRVFTISFEFEGKTYLGLASLKALAENDVQYFVRVYDDTLTKILPDKSLTYSDQKPLCPSSLKHPQALRLFSCISEAVDYHLQVSHVLIR